MKRFKLTPVRLEKRIEYLNYLLLADESEEIVQSYINDGEMYAIDFEGNIAGVVLFMFHPNRIVELKNIAVVEECRGMGLGKAVINETFSLFQSKGLEKMMVGTANSSISTIAFYQKLGFRMAAIKKDFFKKYPMPIYENGIQALDMIMFEKIL